MMQVKGYLACCLALALAATAVRAEEKNESAKVTTTRTETGRASKIRVMLPAEDARLWFDGAATRAKGRERVFRSPALEDGKRYSYKVTAVWLENGREVNHDTKVFFHAGEDIRIDFRR